MPEHGAPLVSIIAISYNHAAYVLETLQSIANQSYSHFELIYADDASSDDSAKIAREWLRAQPFPVKTIVHDENQGVCRTLNQCLALCAGEFVQLIACDDILECWKLELQVAQLQELGEEFAVAHSDATLIDASGQICPPGCFSRYNGFSPLTGEVTFQSLLQRNTIAAMTALIRRSVLVELGGFDESLPYEDYDLWLRIARKYRFCYGERPTARYRVHGANMHLTLKHWREYWVLRKHVDTPEGARRLHEQALYLYVHDLLDADARRDYLQWADQQPRGLRHVGRSLIRYRAPRYLLQRAIAALSGSTREVLRQRL